MSRIGVTLLDDDDIRVLNDGLSRSEPNCVSVTADDRLTPTQ